MIDFLHDITVRYSSVDIWKVQPGLPGIPSFTNLSHSRLILVYLLLCILFCSLVRCSASGEILEAMMNSKKEVLLGLLLFLCNDLPVFFIKLVIDYTQIAHSALVPHLCQHWSQFPYTLPCQQNTRTITWPWTSQKAYPYSQSPVIKAPCSHSHPVLEIRPTFKHSVPSLTHAADSDITKTFPHPPLFDCLSSSLLCWSPDLFFNDYCSWLFWPVGLSALDFWINHMIM